MATPSSDSAGAYPEQWANALGMRFRLIKPGKFMMGSPRDEFRRFADEFQHPATITRPFYLSLYLTTQAEWRAVVGDNPSRRQTSKKAPVESVSWYDCANFIERINSEEYGHELKTFLGERWKYAFPTEAQWEYACRAGTTTGYYFGSVASGSEGNFGKSPSESAKNPSESDSGKGEKSTTTEVGSFPPNPWGFFDMCGNVCEWTSDFYADYDPERGVDPKGAPTSAERVARGGSWRSLAENCRSASRFNFLSTYRGDNCGLRVAIVEDDA